MENIRKELERLPPELRDQMLDQILDTLPPDEDFPPELQRALMKAMLLGGRGLADLLDELSGITLPLPGRGGPRNRRS